MSSLTSPKPDTDAVQSTAATAPSLVIRIDVTPISADYACIQAIPYLGSCLITPVYWVWGETLTQADALTLMNHVLVDSVIETGQLTLSTDPEAHLCHWVQSTYAWALDVQYLPGVTDNVSHSILSIVPQLLPHIPPNGVRVTTGYRVHWGSSLPATSPLLQYDKVDWPAQLAYQCYNPLIQRASLISLTDTASQGWGSWAVPYVQLPTLSDSASVTEISLDRTDAELDALSRERTLALNLTELKTIKAFYESPETKTARLAKGLPTWPTDVELEIIAQTWSEHCKHKILSAQFHYEDDSDPENPYTLEFDNLFKTFIVGATNTIAAQRDDLLSLFKDNAGIIRWDANTGVCFKVETHNSPSALEPYGGAITGIVGVNRDILGTGLGAKPIFNTDVFCFAHPERPYPNRNGLLPPEAILTGVRKGVEDGGNKSGIPTVNGALFFDPRYRAKPLVFCGTGGVMPLSNASGQSLIDKHTQVGDRIIMAGGRVGKDGIHGATFSSEALNEHSPLSAVQIGDPITQKRMGDFLLHARDAGLLTGITDNGAGGLSSSVGEMAQLTGGATIDVSKVPLKYAGLLPYEIVISESQERMTLSCKDSAAFEKLQALAAIHGVELTDIGEFHNRGSFDIVNGTQCVASLPLAFLHEGVPQLKLNAYWSPERMPTMRENEPSNYAEILSELLAHPNVCSRQALIEQYDHEVGGRSVIKPLMGPGQQSPGDAAVLMVHPSDDATLVVSNGLCPQFSDYDAHAMAQLAVDEAVRNAIAVGADPSSIVLLDNFCWPDPQPGGNNYDAEEKAAQLVRACIGLHDIAVSYGTPFISGKDSMKNDYNDGQGPRLSIPPTLLISALGKIPNHRRALTSYVKQSGDHVYLLGGTNLHVAGSLYYSLKNWSSPYHPVVTMGPARKRYQALFEVISNGWLHSCHDCSEGGLAVALAECLLGTSLGMTLDFQHTREFSPELRTDELLFSETPSRFIITVPAEHHTQVEAWLKPHGLQLLGTTTDTPELHIAMTMPHGDKRELLTLSTEAILAAWSRSPASCWSAGSRQIQEAL